MAFTPNDCRTGYDYRCVHGDDKPTEGIAVNSLALEVDTGDVYYFDGTAWQLGFTPAENNNE